MQSKPHRMENINVLKKDKRDGMAYSNYKHDVIDIADLSSMQDTCQMNFVIDLAHRRVSVAQW